MSQFETLTESAAILIAALEDLDHRLAPPEGPAFGQETDLPLLTLPDDYVNRLGNARTALAAGNHALALVEAKAAIAALRSALQPAGQGFAALGALDDLDIRQRLQKLLLPSLLSVLEKRWPTLHKLTVLFLFADERLQEWFPQSFPDRWESLLGKAWEGWKGDFPDAGTAFKQGWPNLVVELLGALSITLNAVDPPEFLKGFGNALKSRPNADPWQAFGWEPNDPEDKTQAEALAERTVTLWWEIRPQAAYSPTNYTLELPQGAVPDRLGLTLIPLLGEHGGPMVVPVFSGDWSTHQELAPGWELDLKGEAYAVATHGNTEAKLTYQRKEPFFTLGAEDQGLSLTVDRFELIAKAGWDILEDDNNQLDVLLQAKKARLALGSVGSNRLLRRIFPNGLAVSFDAGIGYNTDSGFYWKGGLGKETFVPIQKAKDQLGQSSASQTALAGPTAKAEETSFGGLPLRIPHLRLALAGGRDEDGVQASIEAALALELELGPVRLAAEGLGGRLNLAWRDDAAGDLGPLDLQWQTALPDRFALAIDARSVKGGGFLARDDDHDRWVGALSLDFSGRSLDGIILSEQDSLLGIVWVRGLNIPLLGGAIDGLGAMIGSDRRADRDAFLRGLRDNALDAVLFPDDPLRDAPRIIATLGHLFPRSPGHTVLGVMAQWVFGGKARLVVAELGLMVEFDGSRLTDIYLLGQGRVRLARLPENLFRLNLELFGHLDLEADEFLLKLELRDSRLVGGTLTGGGLMYYHGTQGFITSLGGFNPRYPAPAWLGNVPRLTASIADSDNLRIVYQAYLALTTTSFQVGGRLTLWAGAHGFSIDGMLSLDLLARFDMTFFLDVAAAVALKRGSRTLAGIELEGTLSGVSPWRLTGKAKFKVLFFSVSIPVDFRFGGDDQVTFEPADALGPLLEALEDPENWAADRPPAGIRLLERNREGVWLDARQSLRVSQGVVPLGQTLTRLGASPLDRPREFTIQTVRLGGELRQDWQPVQADFAPGLFQDLDLDEALRAPQFEPMDSGLSLGRDALMVGGPVAGGGQYEQVVVDDEFVPDTSALGLAALTETVGELVADEADFYRVAASPVTVEAPRFVVADDGLNPAGVQGLTATAGSPGLSYAQARTLRRQARERGERVQVVRRHEVERTSGVVSASAGRTASVVG